MKRCPTCKRTFEDTLTYCLADGSLLDAPFDPQATLVIPEPRQTEPPAIEVLQLDEETQPQIPPTIASSEPEQKPEESVSTIAAPAPTSVSPQLSPLPTEATRKSRRSPLIVVGVAALLIVGLIIIVITSNRTESDANKNVTTNNTITNTTTTVAASPKHDKTYREMFEEDVAKQKELIRADPNNAELHRLLGMDLLYLGRFAEAETAFREAIRLKPDYAAAHYGLSDALKELGKTAEAKAERKKAELLEGNANE